MLQDVCENAEKIFELFHWTAGAPEPQGQLPPPPAIAARGQRGAQKCPFAM